MRLACSAGEQLTGLSLEPVGEAAIAAYADVSGDDNPLHREPSHATRLGLAGPPLPGLLVLAQFPRMLAAWSCPHRLESLKAQFLRPIPAGADVNLAGRVVHVSDTGDRAILRLTARSGDRLVVAAEAEIGAV
jgi:3-hydroxybutyryl-CoA dehydratase